MEKEEQPDEYFVKSQILLRQFQAHSEGQLPEGAACYQTGRTQSGYRRKTGPQPFKRIMVGGMQNVHLCHLVIKTFHVLVYRAD